MFKRLWKNEKGLTLIELLAVVVILGIIAAIAVPSVGGIIDNTKKDAHIANAKQMVAAARIAIATDNSKTTWSITDLETGGYLEPVKSPSLDYDKAKSKVVATKVGSTSTYTYQVTLFANGKTDEIIPLEAYDALTRDDVTLEPGT